MIRGKTALVTASTYGLGFAVAEALIGAGCCVAINSRSQENIRAAAEKLGPANAIGIAGDLSSASERA